jgi:hypothetical protein
VGPHKPDFDEGWVEHINTSLHSVHSPHRRMPFPKLQEDCKETARNCTETAKRLQRNCGRLQGETPQPRGRANSPAY